MIIQSREIKQIREALEDCIDHLGYFAEDDQPAILSAIEKAREALKALPLSQAQSQVDK